MIDIANSGHFFNHPFLDVTKMPDISAFLYMVYLREKGPKTGFSVKGSNGNPPILLEETNGGKATIYDNVQSGTFFDLLSGQYGAGKGERHFHALMR